MPGKLIVIDGVDSSGKETQTKLLREYLSSRGYGVESVSFPNYDRPYCSAVKMYLAGDFGTHPQDVNPYAASTFYAVDRFASYKENWGKLLAGGTHVLADRYTTSNAIHQGSKLKGAARKEFFDWLYDFEYGKMGLPKPHLVIFLDMPPKMAIQLMKERRNKATGGQEKDIHERDAQYLYDCYDGAIEACSHYGWKRVCSLDEQGNLRTIEQIHEEICRLADQALQE